MKFLDKWPTESSAVPAEVIVDMWETAGITNAKTLLDNLGFATKEIHISQLSLAIDEDMLGVQDEDDGATVSLLLRASLALHKAEVSALQQAFKQLADENRKLHANNRDINRRAAILAQEIDERHAHLENSARTEVIFFCCLVAFIVYNFYSSIFRFVNWNNVTLILYVI